MGPESLTPEWIHRKALEPALASPSEVAILFGPMADKIIFHVEDLRKSYGLIEVLSGITLSFLEGAKKLDFPVAARAAYHEAVWMHYPYLLGERADLDRILAAVAKVREHAAELS